MPLRVVGRQPCHGGAVAVSGAKNAVLPLAFASLLTEGRTTLRGAPNGIHDLSAVADILSTLGVDNQASGSTLTLSNRSIQAPAGPIPGCERTRYSVLLLGILLRLLGRVAVPYPGGCLLGGPRSINIHKDGLCHFGAWFQYEDGIVTGRLIEDRDGEYTLPFPSVTATQTLLLFGALGRGTRLLHNAAQEPEVQDLVDFLNACGGRIHAPGPGCWVIEGVERLQGVEWDVPPDRIEAGSFAILAGLLGTDLNLCPVQASHMGATLAVLQRLGIAWQYDTPRRQLDVIGSACPPHLYPHPIVACPYPGFPTDLHPLAATLGLRTSGALEVEDQVFPNRFRYVEEFRRLGIVAETAGRSVRIDPNRSCPRANTVSCPDIRGGAAVLFACLMCDGVSTVTGEHQFERGYHRFVEKLQSLSLPISCTAASPDVEGRLRPPDPAAER